MCTISTLFKSLFSQRAPDIRHPGRGEEQLRGVVPPVAAGGVPIHPLPHLQVPGLLTLITLVTDLITLIALITDLITPHLIIYSLFRISLCCSIYLVISVAIERHTAVCKPLAYRRVNILSFKTQ